MWGKKIFKMFIVVLRRAQIHFPCKYPMRFHMQPRKCESVCHMHWKQEWKWECNMIYMVTCREFKTHILAKIENGELWQEHWGMVRPFLLFLWQFCVWLVSVVANCCHSAGLVRQTSRPRILCLPWGFSLSNPLSVSSVHVLNSSHAVEKIEKAQIRQFKKSLEMLITKGIFFSWNFILFAFETDRYNK